jgi:DNA-binding GntR family transcriptional regulator
MTSRHLPVGATTGDVARAAERIAAELRADIFSGALACGSALREVELVTKHGASRHTVREALRDLVASGLVTQDPRRSARVRLLTRADIRDVFGLRRVVELEALRRIVEDDAPLGELEAAVVAREAKEPGRGGDAGPEAAHAGPEAAHVGRLHGGTGRPRGENGRYPVPELDADLNFHRAVVRAAGSPRLARTFDLLAGELRLAFLALVDDADDRGDHRAILEAVQARDGLVALELLDTHIRDGLRICLAAAPD